MLVLTRKVGQEIVIGETITIHVLEVRGEQVRLGIKAPKDVNVDRLEVYQDKLENNSQHVQEDTPPHNR